MYKIHAIITLSTVGLTAVSSGRPVREGGGYAEASLINSSTSSGSIQNTCHPPGQERAPRLDQIQPFDQYAGHYLLTVVATDGVPHDTSLIGNLALWPTELQYRTFVKPEITFPLNGVSDIELESLGSVSLAYSPSALDARHPGVQAVYNTRTGSFMLIFGGAHETDAMMVDAGVYFQVFTINSRSFSGRWFDAGNISPRLAGYFCARRGGSD